MIGFWRFFLAGGMFIPVLSACNYSRVKGSAPVPMMITENDLSAPDFANVGPLMVTKCQSCHSTARGKVEGGVSLDSYAEVRARLNRISDRALERKDMPPKNPLSPIESQLLRNWIDNGAPEKNTSIGEKPDPSLDKGANDFAKIRDKIFARKCLDCHGEMNPAAGLDLTKIEMVRGRSPIIFDRVIVKQDMPMAPYPALTPKERRILFLWFDAGMPQ